MKHSKSWQYIPTKYADLSKSDLEATMVDLNNQANAIQANANDAGRSLSEFESNEISDIYANFQDAERELESHQSQGRQSAPGDIAKNRPGSTAKPPALYDRKDKTMKGLFGSAALDAHGWDSGESFLQCIAQGTYHQNLRNASMTEGTGADGGFIVPDFLVANLMDGSLENEIIRPRAKVFPMQSNAMGIAGIDTQDHTSTIGGLTGTWMAEAAEATPQKAIFRRINLIANKLAIFTSASNELVEDGLSFEQQLLSAMSNAITFDMDWAFINGNGAAQPLGILNASSKITVAKESGQAADTVVFENIVKMWSRLHPGLVNDAVWICNSTLIPQLFSMTFPGTGTTAPAFMPAGTGLANAPVATLMGRPIIFTEKCPTLGDEGDLILVALSQYAVGLRREASLQRSIHEGWLTDESDWRLIIRVTGTPLWSDAVTPRVGSTLSWCVTLAERA